LFILNTTCANSYDFSGTQPAAIALPVAQPLPALAYGNPFRPEDGKERLCGDFYKQEAASRAAGADKGSEVTVTIR
jgi:hypothetical protein